MNSIMMSKQEDSENESNSKSNIEGWILKWKYDVFQQTKKHSK